MSQTVLAPLSADECQFVERLRAATPEARALAEAALTVLVAVQHHAADRKTFLAWMKHTARDRRRTIADLTYALRTGTWRADARRLARMRVLKLAGAR
jgi:hypothetical protein